MLNISFENLLLGSEDWHFLLETMLRTLVMFIIVVLGLTILGKRGVKQLSVFELVVIISLGSAAGDPMFYKDVGILPALVVFIVVIFLYSLITNLVSRSKKLEILLEGQPVCLIKDGRFNVADFKKEGLARDEFFAELRLRGISQLGQVEEAIIETSGDISVFFFEADAVKPGLPILPKSLKDQITRIDVTDTYSCSFCGHTKSIEPIALDICVYCKKDTWVKASNKKRIT